MLVLVIVVVVLKELFHDNVKVWYRPWPCEHPARERVCIHFTM